MVVATRGGERGFASYRNAANHAAGRCGRWGCGSSRVARGAGRRWEGCHGVHAAVAPRLRGVWEPRRSQANVVVRNVPQRVARR